MRGVTGPQHIRGKRGKRNQDASVPLPITPSMMDKIEALERLVKLVDQGRISEEEYRSLKNEVLGSDIARDEMADNGPVSASPPSHAPGNDSLPTTDNDAVSASQPDLLARIAQLWIAQNDAARPDMYEVALREGVEPEKSGWFPDPDKLGTHMRFHNGNEWTDSVKPRRAPGWYGNSSFPGLQRYFDGLEYTQDRKNEYKGAPARAISARPKDWKFWVGVGLAVLGAVAVLVTFVVFDDEPDLRFRVITFNLATNPLVWGGVVGAFLLSRWKRETD